MPHPDPSLAELRARLDRLGYVVVTHGDHLCVRLSLLTSVVVRRAPGGGFRFVPQFGPFTRTGGLLATSAVTLGGVGALAAAVGVAPITLAAGVVGMVALAHDACRFVVTEGCLTRLHMLAAGLGGGADGAREAVPASALGAEAGEVAALPAARLDASATVARAQTTPAAVD